jgi:NitT/TauT family transport system permease protein
MKRAGIAYDVLAWRLSFLIGFLLFWEVAVRLTWIDRFHVSQPSALLLQVWKWMASGYILRHLWVTMEEMLLGFAAGTLLGILAGFLFAFLPKVARVFDPLMVLLNALPRVVLAPLFVLWFGLGLLSKVVMAVSLVFFVVFFSTYTGLLEVDREVVNNARILGGTRRDLIRHVYVPSAMTWIFNSLRTSVGFALIGAVVGEYLGSSEGMGWVIAYAEAQFNSTQVLAGLFVLMAVVALMDFGLRRLEQHFSYWKPVAPGVG